jgi:outer membrane protein assembly factor BamB
MRIWAVLFGLVVATVVSSVFADDWPQWMGPQRDGVWRETGIVDRFPESGLEVKWRTPVAYGYAGPAVAGGKVYVADYVKQSGEITNNPGKRDKLEGTERVLCLDAETGKELWKHEVQRSYYMSYPGGPRCTPLVDGDRVYTLGAEGNLYCLNAADGQAVWSKDFKKDYGAKTPIWGFSAHPLVDGDTLYCLVGGPGSIAVAFDKKTGRELWKAMDASEPGYCSPRMIEQAGTRQLLIWHPVSVNGVDPDTGKVFWSVPLKPNYGMSIIAPRKLGDLLYASAFGNAAMMKLDGDKPGAEVLWRGTAKSALYSATAPPHLEEGTIYGADVQTGALIAARTTDGKRLWETLQPTTGGERRGRYGTAYLVKHEDRFFVFSERGDLMLAKLSPAGYDELDRFHVLEPTNKVFGRRLVWSHPAFAGKCMFARNDKELVCVNLAAGE